MIKKGEYNEDLQQQQKLKENVRRVWLRNYNRMTLYTNCRIWLYVLNKNEWRSYEWQNVTKKLTISPILHKTNRRANNDYIYIKYISHSRPTQNIIQQRKNIQRVALPYLMSCISEMSEYEYIEELFCVKSKR